MDYSYVNDRTLRISLTFADLEEHDVQLVDFLSEQEKVEEFFYKLIDELDIADHWSDTGMMTFQIRPNAKGIDILVSDDLSENFSNSGEVSSDLEDFLKQVSTDNPNFDFGDFENPEAVASAYSKRSEKRAKTKKDEEKLPDFIYYTVKFNNFSDLINLSKTVTAEVDESELYEFKDNYYLTILDNQKLRGRKETMNIRARMLEYGEQEGVFNRELLHEHARVIIDHGALETLKKI